MQFTVTADEAGRIILPKSVRDFLQLRAGSRITIELVGRNIILRPIEDEPVHLIKKNGILVVPAEACKTIDAAAAVREERQALSTPRRPDPSS